MLTDELRTSYNRLKARDDTSYELLKHKVNRILLVSSFYDAFTFEEDGVLTEQLFGEYRELDLSFPPRVRHAATANDAMEALRARTFDMVILMPQVGDVTYVDLSAKIKAFRPGLPVLLLINSLSDYHRLAGDRNTFGNIDEVFLYSGDSSVFLAMIKSVEDRMNLAHDTREGMVRVILVIEDSILHYSQFLPILYQLIVRQTQQLISQEVNETARRYRMRRRPKVVLVHNHAEAVEIYRQYRDYLIGIITDVAFERDGRIDSMAGISFIEEVRKDNQTLPVLVQSLDSANEKFAHGLGAHFINKNERHLLQELRSFIVSQLGFGDFVFRLEDQTEVARAVKIQEFMEALRAVPDESLVFHARNNHYSGWLIAHGEVAFAKKIQPLCLEDFPDVATLRDYLLRVFFDVERVKNVGKVVDARDFEQISRAQIVRLAGGSLGGKGRGLAFLNWIIYAMNLPNRYSGIDVTLPMTAIIGTDEYDEFLRYNNIGMDVAELSDAEIRQIFLKGQLSGLLMDRLWDLVTAVRFPLAVRSSGLLEDSQNCPLAGVYKTFMLANSGIDARVRFDDLVAAIKLVFASVLERESREYLEGAMYKLEEEKMAVVVQEMVGHRHERWVYPDISGVAQSHNYYATGPAKPGDGVASVALGLGRTVVEGGNTFRFCPYYPAHDFLDPKEMVTARQKSFWAIPLDSPPLAFLGGETGTMEHLDIMTAEAHGTLAPIVSVWDRENDRLVVGLSGRGPRVINFASILKYDQFPLAELLRDLLEIGEQAMGLPVEIEFAANVVRRPDSRQTFYPLQIRPFRVDVTKVDISDVSRDSSNGVVVHSDEALGNGRFNDICDIVFVLSEKFDTTITPKIQKEVAALNRKLRAEGREYVLIGPGRWGSRDRFLGIPVVWSEISGARVLVEVDLENFRVEASQGAHFFHNLVSRNVAYFKARFNSKTSFVDWEFLKAGKVMQETEHCVHIRLPAPLIIEMDGRSRRGIIRLNG